MPLYTFTSQKNGMDTGIQQKKIPIYIHEHVVALRTGMGKVGILHLEVQHD